MTVLTNTLYDTTEQLPAQRLHILRFHLSGSAEPVEVFRMAAQEKAEPNGAYVECAQKLFAHDKEAWRTTWITDEQITIGSDAQSSSQTVRVRHASELAFCFQHGRVRLDDAFTLANYGRYQHFCQLNGLGVSVWSAEEYDRAFKALDYPLLGSDAGREPGKWLIGQGNLDRYTEGELVGLVRELKATPLNSVTESLSLAYRALDGTIAESYSLAEVRLLAGLIPPGQDWAEGLVADWIEQGVAPMLVAFHYEELQEQLHQARVLDVSRTLAFESFIARNRQFKYSEEQMASLHWPEQEPEVPLLSPASLWDGAVQPPKLFLDQLSLIERDRFVRGQGGLPTSELMELLVHYAQKAHYPLETLYDRLPQRVKAAALPKESWAAFRLDLALYAKDDPVRLVENEQLKRDLQLSPEEWHLFVVKEPMALAVLPHEVICDWRFWHPMTDLARLGTPLKEQIPEGFLHDPEFQRHALFTGLVSKAELGTEIFGINADDYDKVLAYPSLCLSDRLKPQYLTVGLGVVLHNAHNLYLLPDAAINEQVLFAAAYQDIGLLNRASEQLVRFYRLTDNQLRCALLAQTNNAAEVQRFAAALPLVYHTASVYKLLQGRMDLYGEKEGIDREAFLGRKGQSLDNGQKRSSRNSY